MKAWSLIVVVAALVFASVPAAPSANRARNLAATPKVQAALRAAFIRTHSNLMTRSIHGPLRGRTKPQRVRRERDLKGALGLRLSILEPEPLNEL